MHDPMTARVLLCRAQRSLHFGDVIVDQCLADRRQAQGSNNFYNNWTGLYDPKSNNQKPFTGSGFASLELGLPNYLSNQYNRGYFYFRQKEYGLYFQDSWKVNNKLTVNYGLRWDKWTPYSEKYNRLLNLDINALTATNMQVITPGNHTMESLPGVPPSVLAAWAQHTPNGETWVTADQANVPSALLPNINHDLGPRLGGAYKLTDTWVLRASYGIYYWPMPLSQLLQSSRTDPPLNLVFENSIGDLQHTDSTHALKVVPAASEYVGQAQVSASSAPGGSRTFTAFDFHHWDDDMMQQWTFVVEKALAKNSSLRLSYIGNHGSRLEQRWAYNDPISMFNYQASTGLAYPASSDLTRFFTIATRT